MLLCDIAKLKYCDECGSIELQAKSDAISNSWFGLNMKGVKLISVKIINALWKKARTMRLGTYVAFLQIANY